MTVLFRPCGDLQKAPHPRSNADLALRARLTSATGLSITHDHGEPVDYEDWTEPMAMLDAALASGREVLILPRERLAQAMAAPVLRIPGEPGPLMLLGRRIKHDERDAEAEGLVWPPQDHMLAARYAELDTFHARAGRRVALANMLGDPSLRGPMPFRRSGTGGSAAEAMASFGGGSCLVKQVIPIKEIGLEEFEIPEGATPADCERLLWDRLEWHAVHYEGLRDCLLVQEKVAMTHETRVFVVGQGVAGAAACIERHTPLANPDDRQFPDLFEGRRNGGQEGSDPEAARILQNFAEIVVAEIAAEAPDLRSYVLDVALDEERRPLVIEMNPIGDAGLYAVPAARLFAAMDAEARRLAPAPQADLVP